MDTAFPGKSRRRPLNAILSGPGRRARLSLLPAPRLSMTRLEDFAAFGSHTNGPQKNLARQERERCALKAVEKELRQFGSLATFSSVPFQGGKPTVL